MNTSFSPAPAGEKPDEGAGKAAPERLGPSGLYVTRGEPKPPAVVPSPPVSSDPVVLALRAAIAASDSPELRAALGDQLLRASTPAELEAGLGRRGAP